MIVNDVVENAQMWNPFFHEFIVIQLDGGKIWLNCDCEWFKIFFSLVETLQTSIDCVVDTLGKCSMFNNEFIDLRITKAKFTRISVNSEITRGNFSHFTSTKAINSNCEGEKWPEYRPLCDCDEVNEASKSFHYCTIEVGCAKCCRIESKNGHKILNSKVADSHYQYEFCSYTKKKISQNFNTENVETECRLLPVDMWGMSIITTEQKWASNCSFSEWMSPLSSIS